MLKFKLEASSERLDQRIMGLRVEALPEPLAKVLSELSRTQVAQAIKRGDILADSDVHGKLKLKPSLRLEKELHLIYKGNVNSGSKIKAQAIELDILYQDDDIILINKPAGMVVHPAPGHPDGTLVNALLGRSLLSTDFTEKSEPGLAWRGDPISEDEDEEFSLRLERPGIVHRLDRDTSGLLVVARNPYAHRKLSEQWHGEKPKRVYRAIVHGHFQEEEGEIRGAIARDPKNRLRQAIVRDGRDALTRFRVLEQFVGASELSCELETGRTHQIRVHLSAIQHPLFGDPIYGRGVNDYRVLGLMENAPPGQCLHAGELAFYHPRSGERLEFKVDPPPEYLAVRDALERRRDE